jgi:predicted RNA-binding Zn-ribbon protein involved in translation (DUF1610 family)
MLDKVANNMLEFLFDPTVIPVKDRLYFGPDEKLQNGEYERAKADAVGLYKDQKMNSDFYTSRRQQSQREASVMDRKTMIASLDVVAQNFAEDDPIGKDLRVMAYAMSKMSDEQFGVRTAKAKTFKCPKCGTKVLEQTAYCVKCKKKVKPGASKTADQNSAHPGAAPVVPEAAPVAAPEAAPEMEEKTAMDLLGRWNKKASDAVRRNLIAETCADDDEECADKPAKEAAVPHDESKETPEQEAAETPEEQAQEKAMDVEKHEVKAAEEKKEEEKKVDDAKPATPVAPEAAPAPAPAAEVPVQATVDTSILTAGTQSFGFMDMEPTMVEAGEMSAEETAKLDSILRFAGLDDMKVEDRSKLGMK